MQRLNISPPPLSGKVEKLLHVIIFFPPFLPATKMFNKLSADAPPFFPAVKYTHMELDDVNTLSTHFKYKSKYCDLWSPARGWLKSYRCQSCTNIMSRKNGHTFPQQITSCGHIVCADCIISSYIIQQNLVCPVPACGLCVNPSLESLEKH